jgi:hypothetical protein
MLFLIDSIKLFQEPVLGIVCTADNVHSIWVEYAATLWKAKLYDCAYPASPLHPGQFVTVVGIQGTTLLLTSQSAGEE